MPGTSFERAPLALKGIVAGLIRQFHSDLDNAGVRVDVLLAFGDPEAGENAPPPLQLHGKPCFGLASLHNLMHRALGCGDCLIRLDGDAWAHMSPEMQKALVDHELTHFEVQRHPDGTYKRDDLDRPKLSMRKHDVDVGWFIGIAERWGIHSFEFQDFRKILEQHGAAFVPSLAGAQQMPALMEASAPSISREAAPTDEGLLAQVRDYIAETRETSPSHLQRIFRTGWTRTARILDQLEQEGFLGPHDETTGKRGIINREESQTGDEI